MSSLDAGGLDDIGQRASLLRSARGRRWRCGPAPETRRRVPERVAAAARRCLRHGGHLIYATCSVLKEENGDVAAYVLTEGDGLRPAPVFEGALAGVMGLFGTNRAGSGGRPRRLLQNDARIIVVASFAGARDAEAS